MNLARKCNYISNSYYNVALEMATERNLSGAVVNLKRALYFNKNNTTARNLLGLIYNEIGEVGDALVQWIISINLSPEGNPASDYIDTIRSNQTTFDRSSATLTKFNQTLAMCRGRADDMAIIQLQKIVEKCPNYVRALLLLACLYMTKHNYKKATKVLVAAQRIDRGNPKAIQYLNYIRQITRKDSGKKNKNSTDQEILSISDVDIPVNTKYKETTVMQTVANILLGLLIGAAAILFIYLPAKTAQITEESNKTVILISEKLNDANKTIDAQEDKYNELMTEYNNLKGAMDSSDEAIANKFSQYQKLTGTVNYLRYNEYEDAIKLYVTIDSDLLTDIEDESGVSITEIYASVNEWMNATGIDLMMHQGDVAFDDDDYSTALDYYTLALEINPDSLFAKYKLGRCYDRLGDRNTAVDLWTEVIQTDPESSAAEFAKTERGY